MAWVEGSSSLRLQGFRVEGVVHQIAHVHDHRDSEGGKYLKWADASVERVDNTAIGERFANEELDDERVLMFSHEL